ALRSERKMLSLSYERADSDGRTKSASIYIQETRRLTNAQEEKFPRHLEQRLSNEFLPAPYECSTLVRCYSPYKTLQQFYSLASEYTDHTFRFADKLNTMDRD